MPIRVMPSVGQLMIINKNWFSYNQFFTQYMKSLEAGKVYKIIKVDILTGTTDWGIVAVEDIETGEIINIEDVPELSEYWCIFTMNDSIRIVEV